MKLLTCKLPVNHNLFLFGDDHVGTVLRYDKGWNKMVHMMCSSYDGLPANANFGVDHGDIIEAIDLNDPRYDPHTVKNSVLQQIHEAIAVRKPIADKLLTILEGNHPLKKWRFGFITPDVCDALGVQYGTWTSKISMVDNRGRLMYKLFCTHGRKQITSTADDPKRRYVNMKLILKRHMRYKAGDCLIQSKGHTHKLLICEPESELYLVDDGKRVVQKYTNTDRVSGYIHPDHRWYVNTGSFLRMYGEGISGYAEIGEYDPVELGFAIVKVRGRKVVEIKKIVLGV